MATVDRNGLTKRQKQEAKLTLAGQDRAARNVIEPGRYAMCVTCQKNLTGMGYSTYALLHPWPK